MFSMFTPGYWIEYWTVDPISFVIIWLGLAAFLAIVLSNLRSPRQVYYNVDRLIDKLATLLNVIAAAWIMMMAWLVLIDVIALAMSRPIEGTREIIANSVIVILFAQIPLAVRHGGMIRTTILYDNAGPKLQATIDGLAYILGIIFFVAIAYGGWENMVLGYFRQEFENIGKGTIPLWPFRYIYVWFSVLAAIVYGLMLIGLFAKTADQRVTEEAEGAAVLPE